VSIQDAKSIRQVRITEAALGTSRIQGRPARVIRGTLMPDQFDALKIPGYQRMAMEGAKHDELVAALGPDGTGVPDDLLMCVRGDDFHSVGAGEIIIPTVAIYVLDGHQRYYAAMERLRRKQTTDPFGVKIFLGTTIKEEILTFYQVNRLQTPVSIDTLLRNSGGTAAIEELRQMSERTEGFPRVRWDQRKRPGERIKARMLLQVAISLHGYSEKGSMEEIIDALDELSNKIGTERIAENVKIFYSVLDRCFGDTNVSRLMYRADLMTGLALVFGKHSLFWDIKNPLKLMVRAPEVNKLRGLTEREVERDLAIGGTSRMYKALRLHIEKGRTEGLQAREPF